MNIPNELSQMIVESEKFIDDNGELPAYRRKEIHELIEKLSREVHKDAGYYRRAKLAIGCSYFSLPYLDVYSDNRQKAEEALKKAISTLQGSFDIKELESINDRLYTDSVNLTDQDDPNFPAVYASFACFSAINVVLYDSNFEVLGLNEKESDPTDWEACFYASLAHCGGAVWEEVGDRDKRKQFWEWYLHKAIPFAWDTSIPLGPVTEQ